MSDEKSIEVVHLDIFKFFSILWKNKILIILVTSLISIFSVYFSLSLPNYYSSSALLVQKDSGSSNSASLGQYSNIASIAGINLDSGQENKIDFAIATLKSRYFIELIANSIDDFAPILIASKRYDDINKLIIFDEDIYNSKTKEWVREVEPPFSPKPSLLELHRVFNSEVMSVNVDKQTGFITISIELISSYHAKNFLDQVINNLNEISRKNALLEADRSLGFLESELSKVSTLSIKDSLSNLVDIELKKKMMAEVNKDYLLKVIDPPFVPERKSRPSRSIICIIGFIFGLLLSISIVFIKEIFYRN